MSPVALRIVNDVSYVTRINHESPCVAGTAFGDVGASRLANAYFVVQGVVPESYFVVQSSTGVVLCSTELYWCRSV